jgi:hypothetical protein
MNPINHIEPAAKRGCIICSQVIGNKLASITEARVVHSSSSQESRQRHYFVHLLCMHTLFSYTDKKLVFPCCLGEIRKENLYIVTPQDEKNRIQIQATLLTPEDWTKVEKADREETSDISICAATLKKIFAAIPAGRGDILNKEINGKSIFPWQNDGMITGAMVVTAGRWLEWDMLDLLIKSPLNIDRGWILRTILSESSSLWASMLYNRLTIQENKPTLKEIEDLMIAAKNGNLEPIGKAMELPYFYDPDLGNIGEQVLLTAIREGNLGENHCQFVYTLLKNPKHKLSLSESLLPSHLPAQGGPIPMLEELLARRGRELTYRDRIYLLRIFAKEGLSDPSFILAKNPPPLEVIAPDTFTNVLNTMYDESPEMLMVVIAHMESCQGGLFGFNRWIELLCDKINSSDEKTLKFLDYFLEHHVTMTSLAGGGLARAVARGSGKLKGKTLPLLEKLVSYASDGIGQEDNWEILLVATQNGASDVVRFILSSRYPLILTAAQQSILHAVPTSPEIGVLLRGAYPRSFTSRVRHYCHGGWEWISWIFKLPAKVWQKFCSCFR